MDVSRGIGLDDRIVTKFLNPGPGFGGSCFPKDTLALTKLAIEAKAAIRLVETLVEEARKLAMAAKVVRACGGSVVGKRTAVLGLTYDPKTDDMRDAPSLVIIPELQSAGAHVVACDPTASKCRGQCCPASSSSTTPRSEEHSLRDNHRKCVILL